VRIDNWPRSITSIRQSLAVIHQLNNRFKNCHTNIFSTRKLVHKGAVVSVDICNLTGIIFINKLLPGSDMRHETESQLQKLHNAIIYSSVDTNNSLFI
jgi:hypothetical protein